MRLPSAEILLPARARFDLRRTVLAAAGPLPAWTWQDGRRAVLRRAEPAADGRIYLLAIRATSQGIVLRVTGRDAPEAEILAPFAARIRRALPLDGRPRLRGTSLFEDVVVAICRGDGSGDARPLAVLQRLGRRCPAAPRLRAFPPPAAIARTGIVRLRRAGLGALATPVVGLARAVARGDWDLARLEDRAARQTTPALARTLRRLPGVDATAVRTLLRGFGRAPGR